ncbi:deubiquitination-protection protein dph1 [Cyclospora cayetanensis]|uniref:Deubiquitination-protection protein dph1 n=1 Tax=Cyclospora cayetanensis TaxID=88456 RepID=A0A6P6RZB2_9EIME|nr:deubiquitination-protection protein dph1 [Cyclospora cayetanensis]
MSDPPQGQQQAGENPSAPVTAQEAAAVAVPPAEAAAPTEHLPEVSFKVSGGTNFSLNVNQNWTVRELKQKCEEKCQIPVAAQRLIYKGRILKDEDSVSGLGLKDHHIMHLVKGVTAPPANPPQQQQQQQQATPAAGTPPAASAGIPSSGPPGMDQFLQSMLSGGLGAGMGGPMGANPMGGPMGANPMGGPMGASPMGMMGPEMLEMMQTPFFQQAIESLTQNPQMFRSIVESVPTLRPMLPMMQGILDNPERMRAMFSPQMVQASMQIQQVLQQQMRQQQGAATQAEGSAMGASGTPPAAGNSGGAVPPPFGVGPAGFGSMVQQAEQLMRTNPELMSQMMQVFSNMQAPGASGAAGAPGAPGAAPGAPNPFAAFSSFGSLGSMEGSPFQGMGSAVGDARLPEERFASQLQSLTDMGFIDRDANLAALQETNGDVNEAISRLLERGLGN